MADRPARKRLLALRGLTLAELIGLLAVVIAALGYWDSHRERAQTDQERAAAERQHRAEAAAQARAGALKQTFLMTAAPQDGGARLQLTSVHPEQVIQTQAVSFPTEVRGDAVETTGNPRVEAGWLASGLAKSLRKRGQKPGSGRLPMGVVTVYIEDGQTKTDRALYRVGYSLDSRILRSDRLVLEGLSLVRRGVGPDMQGAVDQAWARSAP